MRLIILLAFFVFSLDLFGMSRVRMRIHNVSGANFGFESKMRDVSIFKDGKPCVLENSNLSNKQCGNYMFLFTESHNKDGESLLIKVNDSVFTLRFLTANGGCIVPKLEGEILDKEKSAFILETKDFKVIRQFNSRDNVYEFFVGQAPCSTPPFCKR